MRIVNNLRVSALAMLLLCLSVTAGCGGGVATYPVAGKVTADGKAVEGGTLTFVPVATGATAASSPVIAAVKTDGTFTVTTGAVTGKQTVSYSPPAAPPAPVWDGKGKPPAPPKTPWDGMKPKVADIEIQPGKNDLTIELTK